MTAPEAVRQLQRTIGNHRTAALLTGHAPRAAVQRNPLAGLGAVEAIEVIGGLAQTASVLGDVYAGSLGELTYSSPTAQRLSENSQPVKQAHRTQCLHLCPFAPKPGNVYPSAEAFFDVEWEGNDYGEIGAARVVLNQERSDFFQWSSASVRFDLLNNLIQKGGDRRTWQMQFSYEGTYNPRANGYLAFQGQVRHRRVRQLHQPRARSARLRTVRLACRGAWGQPVTRDIPPAPAGAEGAAAAPGEPPD